MTLKEQSNKIGKNDSYFSKLKCTNQELYDYLLTLSPSLVEAHYLFIAEIKNHKQVIFNIYHTLKKTKATKRFGRHLQAIKIISHDSEFGGIVSRVDDEPKNSLLFLKKLKSIIEKYKNWKDVEEVKKLCECGEQKEPRCIYCEECATRKLKERRDKTYQAKKKEHNMNKYGAKRKEVDMKKASNLLANGKTIIEIANILDVHRQTLSRRLEEKGLFKPKKHLKQRVSTNHTKVFWDFPKLENSLEQKAKRAKLDRAKAMGLR